MLKIGVLGAGHLGKIHLKLLKEIPEFKLVAVFDPSEENAQFAQSEFGIIAAPSIENLIEQVDVVDIVTPTLSHYDCAVNAMRNSKHIFIEKPITNTVEEAKKLIGLSEEANVKVQVGHVERYNPAFIAAQPYLDAPMFIEGHRLAQFNPRGTDVSVVLDLMIHDLDIILSSVKSSIKKISASGVAVVSDTPDIANARIEFDNGCVANLTASRISVKNMRKIRFFQKNAYISIDFFEKETEVIKMKEVVGEPDPLSIIMDLGKNGQKQIYFDKPKIEENNAIKMELAEFADCIIHQKTPRVTIHDGYRALEAAHIILQELKNSGLSTENKT